MRWPSASTRGRSWRSEAREGAEGEREADGAERERRSTGGEAENEELNRGGRIESGRTVEMLGDVRDERVRDLGDEEKVCVT